MEVSYELSKSDISQLFRYIRNHRNQIRPAFVYAGLSLAAFVMIAAVLVSFLDHSHVQGDPPWFYFLVGSLGVCGAIHWVLVRPLIAERAAQNNPQVMGRKTARISAVGIYVKHAMGDLTLHWPLIVDVIDGKDCYYFFLEKNNALTIPKIAFGSHSGAQTFYELARRDWQAARNLASPTTETNPETWPPAPRPSNSQEPDSRA